MKDYDIAAAMRLVTLKLVGYTEVDPHALPRLADDSAILIFGGLARDRPYPGSTTVTTVNGAVTGLVRTLVVELAPARVNALHPAIVGDSPQWRDMPAERFDALVARTPIGRLVTMAEVVDASRFLLENRAINGINLAGRRRLALHVTERRPADPATNLGSRNATVDGLSTPKKEILSLLSLGPLVPDDERMMGSCCLVPLVPGVRMGVPACLSSR